MVHYKVCVLTVVGLLLLCSACARESAGVRRNGTMAGYLHRFLQQDEPFDFEFASNLKLPNMTLDFMRLLQLQQGNSLGYGFFKAWQHIERSVDDQTRQMQCYQQLSALVAGFAVNDLTSYKYFDSWGKIPAGLLKGHVTEFGNFDECVDINKLLSADNYITGKYCFAHLPVGQLFGSNPLLAAVPVRIGVCMPAVCSAQEFDVFFKTFLKTLLGLNLGRGPIVTNASCRLREKPPFTATSWAAVGVLSILVATMAFSSLYEFITKLCGKKPHDLLCAFSVQRNAAQLMRITPNVKSPHIVPCLNGIRCMSIIWVLIGHSATYTVILPHINTIDILAWARTPFSMFIQKGHFSVDSFFFLSGFLLAFIVLRDIERNNGRLNVVMLYVHRILRLTPMLALAILVYTGLHKYMANTPIWNQFNQYTNNCPKNWWLTLLYVQNYVRVEEMCIDHAWYLSVDMQLFILSPILLLALSKWGRKAVIGITAFALALVGCLFATIVVNHYVFHTSGIALPGPDAATKTSFPTHLRASPWFVGLLLGYFMHLTRHKRVQLSKFTVCIGWLLCFAMLMTIIFAAYPQSQLNARPMTSVEEAFFWSLGRVAWPLALAWIVFAGQNGYGGPVHGFLACPLWQPLARLSYCMYIWHILVESFNAGRHKTNTYFSNYDMLLRFWSDYGWTIMFSVVLYLAFEAPLVNLERILLPKRSTNQPTNKSTAQQLTAAADVKPAMVVDFIAPAEQRVAIEDVSSTKKSAIDNDDAYRSQADENMAASNEIALATEQLDEVLESAENSHRDTV